MKRLLAVVVVLLSGLAAVPDAMGQADSFLGRTRTQWLADLYSKQPSVRRSAAFALGRLGAAGLDAGGALLERLEADPDAGVREMAATAVGSIVAAIRADGRILGGDAVAALRKALDSDTQPRVRRAAAYALGCFGRNGAPAAVGSLKKALTSDNAAVRQNAAWALGQLGDVGGDGVRALADLLRDPDALVRRDSAAALAALGREAAAASVPRLLGMIREEQDGVVRNTVLDALIRLAGPEHRGESTDALLPLLQDRDAETQRAAAFALAAIGGPKAAPALPVLRRALRDDDPHVQELAAASLSSLGPDAAPAVVDLARTLKDARDPATRRNAAVALGLIGREIGPAIKPAVPVLVEALQRNQPLVVRQNAAEALAQIHFPNNEEAIPALVRAVDTDPDVLVRQRCIWGMFNFRDLEKYKAREILTRVLDEKGYEHALVRYDAARLLANVLTSDAPDRVADVLLEMLNNKTLRVFNGTDARVRGAGNEAEGATAGVQASLGGDARYMAAEALGWLGDKAAGRRDVVRALKAAAGDPDVRLRETARQALGALGVR
jgi:HEAT repeat protein